MKKTGLRTLFVLAMLFSGSLSLAAKEAAPGGITTDMSVTDASRKAAKMSSQQIGESIDYLKAKLKSAAGKERTNIQKLIKKLEGKKTSREGEEKAQAKHKKTQQLLDKIGDE